MINNLNVCKRCLMDTSASNIKFDKNGYCNFCNDFITDSYKILFIDDKKRDIKLCSLIDKIKKDGRGKKYDCIIGVSGGVDSSYVLVKVKELGLNPLAVHMDNGWNSELAQNNIANLINGLGVDLYTHVIEWDEYKNLMQAFFDSNVVDIELLYDNAMMAVNYKQAAKYGIKYILSGVNTSTEGLKMPDGWNWFKYDKKNIKSIAKIFGGIKLDTFPSIGTFDYIKYKLYNKIEWLSFLDYLNYEKKTALEILENKFSYKPYPYKHYESIFTRFYQGYILPQKFGIDKRKMHLSTLVLTNQLERLEASKMISESPYPSKEQLDQDINYFLKKMNWSLNDLNSYISNPRVEHNIYPSELNTWKKYVLGQNDYILYKILKKLIRK
jgi:N-acetyl sugar amidotransferase